MSKLSRLTLTVEFDAERLDGQGLSESLAATLKDFGDMILLTGAQFDSFEWEVWHNNQHLMTFDDEVEMRYWLKSLQQGPIKHVNIVGPDMYANLGHEANKQWDVEYECFPIDEGTGTE